MLLLLVTGRPEQETFLQKRMLRSAIAAALRLQFLLVSKNHCRQFRKLKTQQKLHKTHIVRVSGECCVCMNCSVESEL